MEATGAKGKKGGSRRREKRLAAVQPRQIPRRVGPARLALEGGGPCARAASRLLLAAPGKQVAVQRPPAPLEDERLRADEHEEHPDEAEPLAGEREVELRVARVRVRGEAAEDSAWGGGPRHGQRGRG